MAYFAPIDASTYSTRSPYVSLAEFKNAPTGTDWNDLLTSTSTQAQKDTILKQCLIRASSWADEVCHQVLAATLEWKQGRSLVRSDDWGRAYFDATLDQTPLIGITQIKVGTAMNDLVALTDFSMVEPRWRNVVRIYLTSNTAVPAWPYWIGNGQRILWQVQYIAGFANASLTAVPSGAALAVDNPLGFNPSQQVTLFGINGVEYPTIAPTWPPATAVAPATLPIVAAPANAYAVGDSVSTMPPSIKDAVINLATVAIRERGQWAIVMRSIREQAEGVEGLDSASTAQLDIALGLLDDHVRVI